MSGLTNSLPSLGLSFPKVVGQAEHKLKSSNGGGDPQPGLGWALTQAWPGGSLASWYCPSGFPSTREGLGYRTGKPRQPTDGSDPWGLVSRD